MLPCGRDRLLRAPGWGTPTLERQGFRAGRLAAPLLRGARDGRALASAGLALVVVRTSARGSPTLGPKLLRLAARSRCSTRSMVPTSSPRSSRGCSTSRFQVTSTRSGRRRTMRRARHCSRACCGFARITMAPRALVQVANQVTTRRWSAVATWRTRCGQGRRDGDMNTTGRCCPPSS